MTPALPLVVTAGILFLNGEPIPEPTLAILNARIWTGNPAQPRAAAVAIAGERILAVGTTGEP